ncbi:MAG: initiation control protein YabA [Desulfotomaculaceae bacterium]|nr:initiation control protein YabA [Desulfotomaculaceae bacterium]MDD4766877.1 initiation control protein YabA [Desulfotomaculaceae bacterium]
MQYLYKTTKEMEIKLHALLAEVQELKNKAREMEEENVRLRKELAAIYRAGLGEGTNDGGAGLQRGFFNLLGLYDHEFHICNMYFGRKRTGDCLFCMAFLRKEQEPAVQAETNIQD